MTVSAMVLKLPLLLGETAMHRYVAALAIGIGLIAHSPAFAELLEFGERNKVPMEECLVAAKEGFELSGGKDNEQRFLIKSIKMGVTWRVYQVHTYDAGGFNVVCSYRSLTSRTT